MDLESFFTDFQNTIKTISTSDEIFSQTAFIEEMSRRLSIAEEIDNLIACQYEGSGQRNKKLLIDGYDFDDEENQLVVAVVDYSQEDELISLTNTEAQKKFAAVESLIQEVLEADLDRRLEPSSDIAQFAAQFIEELPQIFTVRIYLLTNKRLSQAAKALPVKQIRDLNFEYHIWDIERLHRVELSKLGREEIDIDLLEITSAGLPALSAASDDADVATYLTVIPGRTLVEIYAMHGSRILESNVRSFLTAKVKVNKGIRGTVMQEPELFLPFNNGITATATSIQTIEELGQITITGIKNLQIVNGGQTTASLFYTQKNDRADLSKINVQVKLIVVDPDRAEELVPKISRYANTQNKVSEADFFSNHPFHQRMEEKSRQLLAPSQPGIPYQTKWFYERTRGQYLNEKSRSTAGAARKFEKEYPKLQVITKTDAAKYLVTWMQQPHRVSSGAQKNFVAFADLIATQWDSNSFQFGDDYFKELVAKNILFNTVRKQVMKSPWYSSGYLANIVTYAIAKFAYQLTEYRDGMSLNLQIIWNLQDVPDELMEILDEVSELVFQVLTDDSRPVVNVTEWAKREACWTKVKAVDFEMPESVDDFLLTKDEAKQARAETIKNQKVDSEIGSQVLVLELGHSYWLRAKDFGHRMKSISEKEDSIASMVASPNPRRIPSEDQCRVLLQFNERIRGLGFVGN